MPYIHMRSRQHRSIVSHSINHHQHHSITASPYHAPHALSLLITARTRGESSADAGRAAPALPAASPPPPPGEPARPRDPGRGCRSMDAIGTAREECGDSVPEPEFESERPLNTSTARTLTTLLPPPPPPASGSPQALLLLHLRLPGRTGGDGDGPAAAPAW
ncbi:hypothetical protein TSOC_006264 [Tetrabaena socialis]|uniref:Uncharacterized protein n=1 Tax=Tetrabaena socialis TaxID=47790 RepID=A0A2J8A466_9CHLO|nr:hypothetical protein TSOC_006264 [Tetrabaena socialis]|eukprot:PNH07298.1 hypothetical protein TSOC_006264 [Tetrabaena socialis]